MSTVVESTTSSIKKPEGSISENYENARSLLSDTGGLVSLPEICFKLRETLADPDHTQKDIAEIIVHDPALTTRLLRIVNSAYFSLAKPVKNIIHALGIIGEQELNNLVIVTSIVKTMKSIDSGLDIHLFWRASIFSAVLASRLARHTGPEDENPEEYFISGLLLNVGKLLVYYRVPELQALIQQEMSDSGQADYKIEQQQLGFDHSLVGAVMAEEWNFPPSLVENIASHHNEQTEKSSWPQAVNYMAGYFSDRIDFSDVQSISVENVEIDNDVLLKNLSITQNEMDALLHDSLEGFTVVYEMLYGDHQ